MGLPTLNLDGLNLLLFLYFRFWSVYLWGREIISEDKVSACFEKK